MDNKQKQEGILMDFIETLLNNAINYIELNFTLIFQGLIGITLIIIFLICWKKRWHRDF